MGFLEEISNEIVKLLSITDNEYEFEDYKEYLIYKYKIIRNYIKITGYKIQMLTRSFVIRLLKQYLITKSICCL